MQTAVLQEANLQNLHSLWPTDFLAIVSEQTNKTACTQTGEQRAILL